MNRLPQRENKGSAVEASCKVGILKSTLGSNEHLTAVLEHIEKDQQRMKTIMNPGK